MKKLMSILLAALCALLPTMVLAENSTTLKTTVPSEHVITVVCGANGCAVIDGKSYTGTFEIKVPRLGSVTITVRPDDGYGLSQLTVDDLTGVTIKGRKATLSNIHDENTLTISFYKLPVEETPEDQEPTPETEPIGNILYDDYIGTGGGLWQTSIVFNGDYEPEDYELLDVFIDDELQGNSILVCAFPDEEGKVARRSLILSADQMVKLMQKQETEHIIFENGSAIVEMDMVDLLGGDMQKLMALILSGDEEITPETLERDWSLVEPVVIPAAQLRKIDVETRIVPVERENGSVVYEVSVWLRWDDRELDVSGMIPSLTVAIAVDDLVTEDNFDTFTTLYTLVYQEAADEEHPEIVPEIVQLPSTLLLIPDELPEHQDDTAEHFIVTVPDEEGELPVTAYDANAHLVPYRHYVLAADYAGEGIYMVCEAE